MELEEPKIGISGRGLKFSIHDHISDTSQTVAVKFCTLHVAPLHKMVVKVQYF